MSSRSFIRPLQSAASHRPTPTPPPLALSRTRPVSRYLYTHTEAHQGTSTATASSSHPADPSASPSPPQSGPGNVSDHEWNLRAGRAVYTLRTTLPTFFETGLVSRVDASPSSSQKEQGNRDVKAKRGSGSIYAPNIKLSYTPPSTLSLPAPFPKTLQVEGLPLYHASATFIRHTLSAFTTDLHVEMCKLQVRSTGPRHRDIAVRTGVSGKSRISGARNEWDVHSTYTLSPHSALIDLHIVESIHPAPHVTFYDGLHAALARLAGVDGVREAGEGVRCGSDHALTRIPIRQELKTSKKE